jgi:hypothetical protein
MQGTKLANTLHTKQGYLTGKINESEANATTQLVFLYKGVDEFI